MEMINTIPMDNPHKINIRLCFKPEHYKRLALGLNSETMEEKWFVCVRDNILHCYRSWTGFETYRAVINCDKDGNYFISELMVERNLEKYNNTDDKRDTELFSKVLAWLVLGVGVDEIKK